MDSRPPSPLPIDHAEKLSEFIQALYVDRETVASEIDVLLSIYGENAIRIWRRSDPIAKGTLRFEVDSNLPSYEDVHIKVLVSLPSSYPSSSPPQLQLLSRYIGAFGVDGNLFGAVLKTFISVKSGAKFTPDTVVVFDGLQHVIEMCSNWYGQRLSEGKVGELNRKEERSHIITNTNFDPDRHISDVTVPNRGPLPVAMPGGVELIEAEPIIDRRSVFVGRACRISHPSQVTSILSYLMADKRISRAAHPIINAWRCKVDGVMHQDNDDDGETAAGGRLAHLLQILELDGVIVIVTRFFEGIHLGPDRFKHINQAARSALDKGHFLDVEGKTKFNPRTKKRH